MINVTTLGFQSHNDTEELVAKKIKKIEKMISKEVNFDVTLSYKNKRFKCSIMIKDAGIFLRSEGYGAEITPAIDEAVTKMKREIRKIKTKIEKQRNLDKWANMLTETSESAKTENKKEFPVLKKSEAISELEKLNYNFFVYKDAKDNKITIVYKKGIDSNTYGTIVIE